MSDCGYCGAEGHEKYHFCVPCWDRLCGEIQERIVTTGSKHGFDCEHFQNAVESGIKFLVWKNEDTQPPKKPQYDPDSDDADWWKK